MTAYFDTSALAKLLVREPESGALRRFAVDAGFVATSRIGVVELHRVALRLGIARADVDRVLRPIDVVPVSDPVLAAAEHAGSSHLRMLDAIHLASAMHIRATARHFVTYDRRQTDDALAAGLAVASPS